MQDGRLQVLKYKLAPLESIKGLAHPWGKKVQLLNILKRANIQHSTPASWLNHSKPGRIQRPD